MKYVLIFLVFFFFSCSQENQLSSDCIYVADDSISEMIFLGSGNYSLSLGTNDNTAPSIEKPLMNVSLTYTYSIEKHEVTQKEYVDLMGGIVEEGKDNYPITSVTYYDAILYANAKSKKEGYDTAYVYSAISFDSEGRCINLEGLVFNPLKDAYRLPTEAEWVYVAQHGWDPSKAWTNLNSNYQSHPVCSLEVNEYGFCDMAGNVMEWVNDWLGSFIDTTVTNFVGAPDGGSLGQRVVKGGSFNKAPQNITLYSRGDVYAVTSANQANYVGFRLAFGAIPSPVWINNTGASSSRISITATSSQIKDMVGTYNAKVAFVNYETGNLSYIDFSNSSLSVYEIQDTMPVYHPEISPDGKHVAFCTKLEGVSGASSVYIRDLNLSVSNLTRLDVENAAIPRWRVLPDGDTVIVYVSDAGNNKEEADWKVKSTWQVPFRNGKFGTPQKLYNGSFHGGISEDGSLAVSGARLLRANINGKDTVWYNGEQACNVSLSRDKTKRTLFLDFGGKTGANFVGSSYGIHERLLISDSTNQLIQTIAAPKNKAFDHTEWANSSDIAVASTTTPNGAHNELYLISTKDSSLLKLAEGNELWHPSFWINTKILSIQNGLDLDSAGVYLIPNASAINSILRVKMEMFWKSKNNADIILLGSSRIEKGVNPMQLNNRFYALNMATVGALDQKAINFFAQNYVFNHVSNIKYLVISLDIDGFSSNGSALSYLYQEMPGYIYDANHEFWKYGLPDNFEEAVEKSLAPSEALIANYSTYRGATFDSSESWRGENPLIAYDSLWAEQYPFLLENAKNDLLTLIQECKKRNVKLIGIIFPQSPYYKNTGSFGRYGLSRTKAKELIEWLKMIQNENSNFILMDENKFGSHDYDDSMAYDYDHLSIIGAYQLTSRLDSILISLE